MREENANDVYVRIPDHLLDCGRQLNISISLSRSELQNESFRERESYPEEVRSYRTSRMSDRPDNSQRGHHSPYERPYERHYDSNAESAQQPAARRKWFANTPSDNTGNMLASRDQQSDLGSTPFTSAEDFDSGIDAAPEPQPKKHESVRARKCQFKTVKALEPTPSKQVLPKQAIVSDSDAKTGVHASPVASTGKELAIVDKGCPGGRFTAEENDVMVKAIKEGRLPMDLYPCFTYLTKSQFKARYYRLKKHITQS